VQSRKDHVQAYQFVTARLGSALTLGEVGRGEQPLRRSALGLMWGLVIALLICGGLAVYGLIVPGGATSWRQAGSIIVEKETGARYLYVNGTLYPTINTASAMLYLAGASTPTFRLVSRNSLAGVPHGRAVGIPGAPDSLPTKQNLLPPQWSLCAAAGATTPSMVIDLDPGTRTGALPTDARFLVQDQDGVAYVVWRDAVYPVGSRDVLVELGLGDVVPTQVPMAWLHSLRRGQVLTTPVIPGAGRNGPVVAGQPTRIGELLVTTVEGQPQDYVLREDGVAPVNPTALALLAGAANASAPRQLSPSALAGLPESRDTSLLQGMPNLVGTPVYRSDRSAVCVRQSSSGGTAGAGHLVTEQLSVPAGRTTLNVPPGHGMIAMGQAQGTYFLITDVGEKFAIAQEGLTSLELSGTPAALPAEVLAAMPSGPDLVTGASVLTANNGEGS
jgi:type VII secretion protein EccB